jgi:nitroreductase
MELLEGILTRRSIRKYTDEKISDNLIKKLLQAGMAAPSANNQQAWHFVVINNRQILAQIPTFHPYSQMLKNAPVAILVCGRGKEEKYKDERIPIVWGNNSMVIQDCSAATQNILLAAHGLGLGAVWLGIYPIKDFIDRIVALLNLPNHLLPLALISIGYPAENKPKADRYDEAKVNYNNEF